MGSKPHPCGLRHFRGRIITPSHLGLSLIRYPTEVRIMRIADALTGYWLDKTNQPQPPHGQRLPADLRPPAQIPGRRRPHRGDQRRRPASLPRRCQGEAQVGHQVHDQRVDCALITLEVGREGTGDSPHRAAHREARIPPPAGRALQPPRDYRPAGLQRQECTATRSRRHALLLHTPDRPARPCHPACARGHRHAQFRTLQSQGGRLRR